MGYEPDISNFFEAVSGRYRLTAVDVLKTLFDQPKVAETLRTHGLSTVSILDATWLIDDVSERGAQHRSTPIGQKLGVILKSDEITDLAVELLSYIGNPQFGQEVQDAIAGNRSVSPAVDVFRDIRSFTQVVLESLRDRVTCRGVTALDVDDLIAALE